MKPSATVASSMARFKNFWPPKRTDLVIKPLQFCEGDEAAAERHRTYEAADRGDDEMSDAVLVAAIQFHGRNGAAAPPPMPLYRAIICGMSVIATRLPLTQARMPPMAMAATTRIRLKGGSSHEDERHQRRQQHADAGPADAAHGGDGRAHAFQAENEQRRRRQVGQLRQGLNGQHGGHFLRTLLFAGRHEHFQHAFGHHISAHGVAGAQDHPR